MRDARVEKLADILVDYSVAVKKGDLLRIVGSSVAEPLILAIYQRCLERGAHASTRITLPGMETMYYRYATDEQLDFIWPPDRWLQENLDASFHILASTNTRALSGADPDKQARRERAVKELQDIYFHRSAVGEYRWNLTLYPTEAYAMDAEMSLEDYEDFLFGACLIDADDPVAEWRKLAQHNARVVEWMKGRNEVHIEGDGTDLTLEIGGRTFIPSDGHNNFPDGEVFTGPIEDRTRGHVTFTYPAIYRGVSVEGIRLEFHQGRVVGASAKRNEEVLVNRLDTDDGARTLGELGIGTNYGVTRFSGEGLLDEKIGGTIHLAVGASYPETDGVNQSAIHWDMVCDLRKGGRVTVDGDVLMENGRLLVE
jgi:aminopeptidase